ncbi:MAG: sulfide dehydrogenase [Gammaproteobacteria bacterium]|nr:sulfide dehydrogenase [Gammaproteobacteria bacterium]
MKSCNLNKRLRSCLIGTACAVLLPVIAQADELSRAAMLSYTCAGCHGTNGISPGSIPSIYCKTADTIEKALKEYRDGTRFSTVMGRHVKGYTDDEIQLIAGFFGTYCNEKIGIKK